MNNPLRTLQTLGRHLTAPAEITLFGPATLALGYAGCPAVLREHSRTRTQYHARRAKYGFTHLLGAASLLACQPRLQASCCSHEKDEYPGSAAAAGRHPAMLAHQFMSAKRQPSGQDYPEAAVKHCDDARHLLSGNRADGAAYLAGYAVECALKTLIQVEAGAVDEVKQWGHNLNDLSKEALRLAAQPTNKTARYLRNPALTTLRHGNPPMGWTEVLRYYPVGTVPAATAEQWVEEAERLYIEVIGEMKKNGEI